MNATLFDVRDLSDTALRNLRAYWTRRLECDQVDSDVIRPIAERQIADIDAAIAAKTPVESDAS